MRANNEDEEAECERTPCCRLFIVVPGSFGPSLQSLLVSYPLQIFSFAFIFEHIKIFFALLITTSMPGTERDPNLRLEKSTKRSDHGRSDFPVNGRVGMHGGPAGVV